MKLRGVREGNLRRLLRHGTPNFRYAMADAYDGGLSGGIQEAGSIGGNQPGAFAANGDRKGLAKISRK
jgi:hypothetical protein